MLRLSISWDGPYTPCELVRTFNDWGGAPSHAGEDYELYQIYGRHILGDRNALLYIGEATDQTFAARLRQHEEWLQHEWPVGSPSARFWTVTGESSLYIRGSDTGFVDVM